MMIDINQSPTTPKTVDGMYGTLKGVVGSPPQKSVYEVHMVEDLSMPKGVKYIEKSGTTGSVKSTFQK